jgi:rRNA-processing protein FCF1
MASDRLCRDRKERIVILDTNALMMLFEFSIDLEAELNRLLGLYCIFVPTTVLDELRLLSENGKGKQKIIAKSALALSKNYKCLQTHLSSSVDDSLISLAKENDGIVLTNDKEKVKRDGFESYFSQSKKEIVTTIRKVGKISKGILRQLNEDLHLYSQVHYSIVRLFLLQNYP